jgi:phage tail tube protein FII
LNTFAAAVAVTMPVQMGTTSVRFAQSVIDDLANTIGMTGRHKEADQGEKKREMDHEQEVRGCPLLSKI